MSIDYFHFYGNVVSVNLVVLRIEHGGLGVKRDALF